MINGYKLSPKQTGLINFPPLQAYLQPRQIFTYTLQIRMETIAVG
jgi:hypothetical protein